MTRTTIIDRPRSDDEVRLTMLDLSASGLSMAEIGRQIGKGGSFVRVTLERILIDDLNCSGEPEDIVRAAYPGVRT